MQGSGIPITSNQLVCLFPCSISPYVWKGSDCCACHLASILVTRASVLLTAHDHSLPQSRAKEKSSGVKIDFASSSLWSPLLFFLHVHLTIEMRENKELLQVFVDVTTNSKNSKFHPNIKFTAEISENEITFLDTVVFKGERFKKESILENSLQTY